MEEKRVKDLMLLLEEYATVPRGATVREALLALNKAQLGLTYDRHHHRAVLVLEPDGAVAGKLSHWAILRTLEPKLLADADVASLERAGLPEAFVDGILERAGGLHLGLEAMCEAAGHTRVEEAMVPVQESLEEEAPLTDAIDLFVRARTQSLLVTRGGEAVGLLRLSDVFEEVADLIRGGRCGEG